MGDRILKVNGSDVTSATHQEAVMELLRPCDDIRLTIQHDPLPNGFQVSFQYTNQTPHFIMLSKFNAFCTCFVIPKSYLFLTLEQFSSIFLLIKTNKFALAIEVRNGNSANKGKCL